MQIGATSAWDFFLWRCAWLGFLAVRWWTNARKTRRCRCCQTEISRNFSYHTVPYRIQKSKSFDLLFWFRRRPTFPGGFPPSIISTAELNYRVRNGNGCDLCVIVTEYGDCFAISKLNNANFDLITHFIKRLSL